jgi:hypothetical protein
MQLPLLPLLGVLGFGNFAGFGNNGIPAPYYKADLRFLSRRNRGYTPFTPHFLKLFSIEATVSALNSESILLCFSCLSSGFTEESNANLGSAGKMGWGLCKVGFACADGALCALWAGSPWLGALPAPKVDAMAVIFANAFGSESKPCSLAEKSLSNVYPPLAKQV